MKAIPFAGIEGWLNSKPLELSMLKGKVILLDFWTYSCINCVRTLPHLKQLWEKYKNFPFLIIGIHTPEFAFEKKKGNVEIAINKYGISYPVALDSENVTWKLYGNRYWPKQVLISGEGEISYGHVGEGGYEEIERNVVEQLQALGVSVKFNRETNFRNWFHLRTPQPGQISPETYVGSSRGEIASSIVCSLGNGCHKYGFEGTHEHDKVYLDGDWIQEHQYAIHTGEKGSVLYKFRARSVHVVLDAERSIECWIFIDNKALNKYNAGSDIIIEKDSSKIFVDKAGLYNLYQSQNIESHEIKIETKGGLKVYAFTFG